MYIDHIKEHTLIQGLLARLPKVNPYFTAVFNVSPDYSSNVAMQVAHYLSDHGKMLDLFPVEVPYPGEDAGIYQEAFKEAVQQITYKYEKIILVEAAVLSGNNYTWIKEFLLGLGYEDEDIITVSLLELFTSKFKCDFVGEYSLDMPEFYWERYNKHWD